jgi:hypothetical protein
MMTVSSSTKWLTGRIVGIACWVNTILPSEVPAGSPPELARGQLHGLPWLNVSRLLLPVSRHSPSLSPASSRQARHGPSDCDAWERCRPGTKVPDRSPRPPVTPKPDCVKSA